MSHLTGSSQRDSSGGRGLRHIKPAFPQKKGELIAYTVTGVFLAVLVLLILAIMG